MKHIHIIFAFLILSSCQAQKINRAKQSDLIPEVYSNIVVKNGNLYFQSNKTGDLAPEKKNNTFYTLENISKLPKGTENGVAFDFGNDKFYGTIYYGLYSKQNIKYQYPVLFKKTAKIIKGKAEINIKQMSGRYDIAGFTKTGKFKLGYRITNNNGELIYDGVVNVKGKGPFTVDLTITQGPFVNKVAPTSVTIWFNTSSPSTPYVEVNSKKYYAPVQMLGNMRGDLHHEIPINNLKPDTEYQYTVHYGDNAETYSFRTAPKEGSRTEFTFAYASDSRAGSGGGERNLFGVNAYTIKKMAALALKENARFMQFTGDLISGYSNNIGKHKLEYANWKITMQPYWHYIPFMVAPGNHEALLTVFDDGTKYGVSIDKFPFNSVSDEAVFAKEFVNPENGPVSEDGTYYDPDKNNMDFPPYKETAYYYTYDNVAFVVLNSNYWYTPDELQIPETSGNVHGYVMDKELEWMKQTIDMLDKDNNIDHIFVTLHTPAFPNAGHSGDDMWYGGNNKIRPYVAGKKVKKGIIERREEFLDILINRSEKVLALLCGDEHNYTRLEITDDMPRFPKNYKGIRTKISRPFWQITNGSAGAPYYGLENLPWTKNVKQFSTQYALMLFDIHGKSVKLRVINPDTFEKIEDVTLR